jgi:4-diphosphocytidyl-2-C-methyl-D-erythritol kinase
VTMLTIKAPAKINLTLEVLGKRPDGFHEVRSVLQTIGLYDTLQIEKGQGFTFKCSLPGWSAEKSLVSEVSSLLPKDFKGGASVKIEKNIPLMIGLGGDSSDAAALFKGLNDLYELNISDDNLQKMANELGSDVAFFLQGGTAFAEGRGEKLTSLPPLKKKWIILAIPDVTVEPDKTTRMYAALQSSSYSDGGKTKQLVEVIKKSETIDSGLLCNAFEDIVLDMYPGLSYYISGFIRSGVSAHITGAGPALFTIFDEKAQAENFYKICQDRRVTVHLVATV